MKIDNKRSKDDSFESIVGQNNFKCNSIGRVKGIHLGEKVLVCL